MTLVSSLILKMRCGVPSWIMVASVEPHRSSSAHDNTRYSTRAGVCHRNKQRVVIYTSGGRNITRNLACTRSGTTLTISPPFLFAEPFTKPPKRFPKLMSTLPIRPTPPKPIPARVLEVISSVGRWEWFVTEIGPRLILRLPWRAALASSLCVGRTSDITRYPSTTISDRQHPRGCNEGEGEYRSEPRDRVSRWDEPVGGLPSPSGRHTWSGITHSCMVYQVRFTNKLAGGEIWGLGKRTCNHIELERLR